MNKTVPHYISELLYLHDCVILPNFGGFVCNKVSAQLNKNTNSLTPPSKQILFNRNLKTNDGLLITHIANQEGISQDIAKDSVLNFANESNSKLTSSKLLRIDKVGLFTLGQEGNIIYIQDRTTNYSLENFGMSKVQIKKVKITEQNEQKTESSIKNISDVNFKTFMRAAAVIIPLVFLSLFTITNEEEITDFYTQMASFNPLSKNKIAAEKLHSKIKIEKKDIEVIKNKEILKPTIKQKNTNTENTHSAVKEIKYYIIAGAFSKQQNAEKMLHKLNRWNYNAEIINEKKFMRVSYDSFHNRKEAVLALNKIRKENPNAWLLTK